MATEVVVRVRVEDAELQQFEKDVKGLGGTLEKIESKSTKTTDGLSSGFDKAGDAASNLDGGIKGVATQFGTVTKAAKKGGAAMRSALISTGIGALVVALGLIVDNWEAISEWIGLTNKDLERQAGLLKGEGGVIDSQLKIIENEIKLAKLRGEDVTDRLKLQKDILAVRKKNLVAQIAIAEATLLETEALAIAADNGYRGKIKGSINEEETLEIQKQTKAVNALRNALLLLTIEEETPEKKPKKDKKIPPKTRDKIDDSNLFDDGGLAEDTAFLEQLTTQSDAELALIKQSNEAKFLLDVEALGQKAANELEKTRIEQEGAAERQRIADIEAANKVDALWFYADASAAVASIIGEHTAAGKAFAVASTLISTYFSAQKAYESQFTPLALIDSPVRGAIAAGVAVAAGLANVKAILSTKTPGGGGGGQGAPSVSAPSFNVVGTSGQNQIAQSLSQQQEPIQAYVVGSNVTTQQGLDRNIVETATIG